MMAHTHLHELLKEDQEPFQLKNYIADRRSQLKLTETTTAAVSKRKPIIEPTATLKFCINHACLFTFQDSPDVRNSQFIDFPSPATKSPSNSVSENNAVVFLNVPARTSAVLLDATMRVQKQSFSKSKPPPSKNVGFGLLGSFLKRLKHKSTRTKRHEISSLNNTKSSLPIKSFRGKEAANDVEVTLDANGSAYCRLSSADWSEKSSESETSCSSISVHESYETRSLGLEAENHVSSSSAICLCSSPSSPFRFSLQKSPSLGHRTPDFLSPATSPSRRFRQDKENYDIVQSKEISVEDEEQCSPVSVLDPPFEDYEHEYDVVEGDAYDLESSYATLQRTKHQLLQKLLRFERLVELDPIALEKHMAEECDDDDYECIVADVAKEESAAREELFSIIDHLGIEKIPLHVERLVLDLISEENKNEEHEAVVKRVCKRFDSWKLVESNTIDMMVEFESRKEKSEGWKMHDREMAKEIVMSIEVAIIGVLVEEFAQELVDSCMCLDL